MAFSWDSLNLCKTLNSEINSVNDHIEKEGKITFWIEDICHLGQQYFSNIFCKSVDVAADKNIRKFLQFVDIKNQKLALP